MDKIKRFINISVPVDTCNLRCPYCYITLSGRNNNRPTKLNYSPKQLGLALSKTRLGGICHVNVCGTGETLFLPEIAKYIEELLLQGHYVMIVTNGLLSKKFSELMNLPSHLLKRLCFKMSFHYLQLLQHNKLNQFVNNINLVQSHGCSFSVELTPHDELIPHINDIKTFCLKHFGALCHVTVARDTSTPKLKLLTSLSKEEYHSIWSQFNSDLFEIKMAVYDKKRTEYCYAGDWSLWIDLGTGYGSQCYSAIDKRPILKNPLKNICFFAVGKHCRHPYCHNAHALLSLGVIAEYDCSSYAVIRNRITTDGSNWLNEDMYAFLNHKLKENNKMYSWVRKLLNEIIRYFFILHRLFTSFYH